MVLQTAITCGTPLCYWQVEQGLRCTGGKGIPSKKPEGAALIVVLSSAVFRGLFYIPIPFTFPCGNI